MCAVASHWSDAAPLELQQCLTRDVAPYQPGQFYRRELVPVLNVLQRLISAFEVIVIDGYVVLDDRGSPGLGAHLYEQLGGKYAVVGVAKTAYKGSGFAAPVLRGTSRRPLFVTARGVSRELAARSVAQMHGKDRIPTLLRLVDRTARS